MVALKGGAKHISISSVRKPHIILLLLPFGPFIVFWESNLELQLLGSGVAPSTPASVTDWPASSGDSIVCAEEVPWCLGGFSTLLAIVFPIPKGEGFRAVSTVCT